MHSHSLSRRRFVQSTAAASVALASGLPSLARAQAPVALRFSSSLVADQNSAHYVWYQRLDANLKAAVGDRIRIDYFPNNQLGKESDVVQQVKVGSIDMMVTGSSIWATAAPQFGMLDLGYLFDSYAHAARALDGGVGAKLNDILQKSTGCQVITWASHFGARSVYTRQPVKSLAEVKNVKLRVLPTPAFIETFKIMGAIPTPIPFGELYMAAQTGVVDGFEHDAATVLASKLNEVAKNCWLTEHLFSPLVVVMGKRGMDKIPADLRPAFLKAAADATAQQRAIATDKGAQAIDALTKLGMVFNPMAKAERDAVRKDMEARLWSSFAKEHPATAPLFTAISAARV
ncbi:TRAP transporter substrate-binding protein [Polaromonas sp. JS666]|uniref:TRAP transporter substrate-binding protein n=1 Tax=Polaromonas sp. (strain JS666 / ATCC BAA-500) TaxID=296591 RepID=UPI0000463E22|nr:TRAP transporter substrate-binding protein [Polaromonas sp. JS666]ABE46460.1 TRAP dicarboxylate transporter, DctP subunit [Polaromonas sp. JS666]